jgi:mannan endo-1,4-beta-mannosidase
MKKRLPSFSLLLLVLLVMGALQLQAQAPELVNTHATQKAKDVYSYIYNAKHQGLITGQHNYAQTWLSSSDIGIRASRLVHNSIGEWPGLWGSDFSFTDPNYTIEQLQAARQKMIDVAKAQAAAGSLVTLTYHMVTPKLEENQGWTNVKDASLTEAEYLELVTPGTPLYNNWARNMDRVIPFLKQLENDNIAVVWRPYHEMNGLFWWGKGEGSLKYFNQLWINTYEYMVNNADPAKRLNNLIWFWSPNHFSSWGRPNPTPWFPGLDYVDMLGIDDYWWTQEGFLSQGDYDHLVNLAQGKPLAIGEGFNPNMVIPDPDWMRENRPEYRWFMLWDGEWINDRINDPLRREALTAIYKHENAINQDNIHIPAMDVVDNSPPGIPQNLRVTEKDFQQISLAWDAATDENGVSGYEIYVNGVYVKFTFNVFTTLKDLAPATEYTITIKARDHYMNRSEPSSPLIVATEELNPEIPSVPADVKLLTYAETTLSLSWGASSSNVPITGYRVYANAALMATVTTLHTTLTGLASGQAYAITVTAINGFGQESEPSAPLEVSTYALPAGGVKVNDKDFNYVGNWGSSTGSGKYMNDDHYSSATGAYYEYTFVGTKAYIFASKAPHHGIAGVSINGGPEVMVDYYAPFRINETIIHETEELPLGRYTIKVRVSGSRNANATGQTIPADRLDYVGGEGDDTTPPTKPTGLAASSVTHSSVVLSWTASTDDTGVFGYDVYVDGQLKIATPETSATISGLSELTTYRLHVVARDGFDNLSEPSDSLEVTTLADTDINLILNGSFEYEFTSWTGKAGDVVLDSEHAHHGEVGLKVGPANWSWLQQTFSGWEAGKTYTFSAWGKVQTAGNSLRVAVKTRLPGATADVDLLQHNFTSLEWSELSGTFTVPEGVSWLQVYISNRTTGTGWVDLIKVVGEAPEDTEAPTAPLNLVATSVKNNAVTLSWDAATDNVGVTGYDVYVEGELNTSTQTTAATVAGLRAGTAYTFTVIAKDAADNRSEASAPLTVTTSLFTETNLLQNSGFEQELLGWNVLQGDVTIDTEQVFEGQKALRVGTAANSWVQQIISTGFVPGEKYTLKATGKVAALIGSGVKVAIQINSGGDFVALNFTTTSFESKSVEVTLPETTTSVKVYATNRNNGTGFFDNIELVKRSPVDTEAPSVPTGLTAGEITKNSVALSWTAATDNVGVTAYDVYVNGLLKTSSETNSATVTGLAAGTPYAFTVTARDAEGNTSEASAPLEVSTLPDNERNFLTNSGFEQDLLGWNVTQGDGAIDTGQVFEGDKALRVGPASWGWVEQILTSGFVAGETYTLKAVGKMDVSNGSGVKVAIQINNSGSDLAGAVLNFTSTTFESKSLEVTLPAHTTSVKVYITNRNNGTGYFDNVMLVQEIPLLDTEAPTTPANLTASATENSIQLAWEAATDNVGVVGYHIYLDDAYLFTSTETSAEITALAAATSYTVAVSAVDLEGNESEKAVITIETEALPGLEEPLPGGGSIAIYPNPFTDQLTIQLVEEPLKGTVKYFIQRIDGRTVMQGTLNKRNGYTDQLDTQHLPSGAYILKLIGELTHTTLIMKK